MALLLLLRLESKNFAMAMVVMLSGAILFRLANRLWQPQNVAGWLMVVTAAGVSLIFGPIVASTALFLTLVFSVLLWSELNPALKLVISSSGILILALLALFRLNGTEIGIALAITTSMLMVRSLIAMLELIKSKPPHFKDLLSYFAVLPSFVMPIFPAIDFNAFVRSRNGSEASSNEGVRWIYLGLVQLILYRILQNHPPRFQDVMTLGGLGKFLFLNFLLYMRISGAFHLVVGALRLYGIVLPKTHNNYLFSESIVDFWRRINIYWRDFMAKAIYTPTAIFLQRRGFLAFNLIAIVMVFLATWFLHSFQILITLGHFPLRVADFLFWGLLCILMILSSPHRIHADGTVPRISSQRKIGFFLRWRKISVTMMMICLLWGIWSLESPLEILARLLWFESLLDSDMVWWVAFPALGFLGASFAWAQAQPHFRKTLAIGENLSYRLIFISVSLLLVISLPSSWTLIEGRLPGLSRWVQHNFYEGFQFNLGGYYEEMAPSRVQKARLAKTYTVQLADTDFIESVDDYRRFIYRPNAQILLRGEYQRTNEWGMIDRPRPLEKIDSPVRIALLGTSSSLPFGVKQGAHWPHLVEDRLQTEGFNVELLNFSVQGASHLTYPYTFLQSALRFKPDMIFVETQSASIWRAQFETSQAVRSGKQIPFPELFPLLRIPGSNSFLARHYFSPDAPESVARSVIQWSLRKIFAIAQTENARPIFLLLPSPFREKPDQQRDLLYMATEIGYEVLDCRDAFREATRDQILINRSEWGDESKLDPHLNSRGHRLLSTHVARLMRERISEGNP